jgi:predicted AlkP superfamily phosphohydrolase/phosphomutase
MARRCLVVGIDGLPRNLLEQLAEQAVMPFCARLLRQGSLVSLRAPVPEVSSTSWATFLTGVNPARHGIYGFIDLKPFSYQFFFPNLKHLAAPTLWDFAGRVGLRTLCLNVPTTYPAPPLNGVLISGFPAPDFKKCFFPQHLAEELDALGYVLDVEVGDVADDPAGFLRRIEQSLDARVRAFTNLLEREDWDLGIAVFTETDRLQHFLWNGLADPTHPLHAQVLDIYRRVDQCIEALAARINDGDALFLVSDHGFAGVKAQIYLNAWLRRGGYLALPPDAASFDCIDAGTKAFALDPGRIYIHRSGRFPRGAVSAGEAEELRQKLRLELRALTWHAQTSELGTSGEGEPVLQDIFLKEEIYSGSLLESAADLIAVPATGFNLRGAWKHSAIVGNDSMTGTHTRGNAVFYYGGDLTIQAEADMQDVAPTVLSALGVDYGVEFDGHNLSAPAEETSTRRSE